jgi:dsRNA-specific ribonuclease
VPRWAGALGEVIGTQLPDEELAFIALHPERQGFSRLEFIGDAVLGVAVTTVVVRAGLRRELVPRHVSNRALDEVYRERLRRLVPGNSGDVVEAVVGAAHLTLGFDDAAAVAVNLAFPARPWSSIAPRPVPTIPTVAPRERRSMAFLGATLFGAGVADHLVRDQPSAPHRVLSDERQRLLAPNRVVHRSAVIARLPAVTGLRQRRAYDLVQGAAAAVFLAGGWPATTELIAELLELADAETEL